MQVLFYLDNRRKDLDQEEGEEVGYVYASGFFTALSPVLHTFFKEQIPDFHTSLFLK